MPRTAEPAPPDARLPAAQPPQAELDVIVDLLANVQGGQLMALQHITRPSMSADAKFADMAASNMARLAARQVRALATRPEASTCLPGACDTGAATTA